MEKLVHDTKNPRDVNDDDDDDDDDLSSHGTQQTGLTQQQPNNFF